MPTRIIFSPLVKLDTFKNLLYASRMEGRRIEEKIRSIKAQKTTSVFYIPAGGPLAEDHVVRFDELHSMPVAAHSADPNRQKLFTLSNIGFYMLAFKLSIHFCRLQEKVNRNDTVTDS